MEVVRISLFLTLLAVALCETKDGDDIIGTDSDLLDNVTAEDVKTDDNEATESDNLVKENDDSQEDNEITPTRRFFDLFPKKNCVCFPGSPLKKTISQHLNTAGSTYERLVVYFYRNTGTNEIKVYVPNKARQILFPDITYEISDGLNNLNPGSIDAIASGLGPIIKSWISVNHKKPEINLEIVSNLDKNKLQALLLYLKKYKETKSILGKLTALTVLEKLKQLKLFYPHIYAKFVAKINKFFPVWLSHGKIKHFKPNQLINFPYDIKLIPVFEEKKVIVNGRVYYNFNELIVYRPPHVNVNIHYKEIININNKLNLDLWLNVVIKHLNNQLQFAAKTLDVGALKSTIISILQKNGITITATGSLVDASRRPVKLTNIILRPLLIGESGVVTKVINNGLFRIPASIVFVEVILLGGVKAKSLGIIPIGNIFIGMKKVEISTVVEVIETTVTCEGGRCQTVKKCKNLSGNEIVCQRAQDGRSGNSVVIQHDLPNDVRGGNSVVIQHDMPNDVRGGNNVVIQHDLPTDLRGGNTVVIQSRDDETAARSIGCPNCYRCGNHICSSPLYISNSDGSNKVYISNNDMVDIPRSGISHIPLDDDDSYIRSGDIKYVSEDNIDEGPSTRIIPGIANSKQNPPLYIVTEDGPGIRIVGGGAATSSGTPVSSKG